MTKIFKSSFSKTADGRESSLYTLDNGTLKVTITDFGGSVVSILTPDKNGKTVDVSLGYDDVSGYEKNTGFIGALIGRFGNRIAKGRFTLNGKEYTLYCNNGANHLHGGKEGFDRKLWNSEVIDEPQGQALKLTYKSPDGEEGYPGNLDNTVIYRLTDDKRLSIDYSAVSDADTIINLTNHAYFNLNGHNGGSVLNHLVKIYAKFYTPINEEVLPTGEIASVEGTPYDFSDFHAIGERIDADDAGLKYALGYDTNFVLDKSEEGLPLAAEVLSPETGIKMRVYTNKPGMQFYSGNNLDPALPGKGGTLYPKNQGFCMETQFFPDGINKENFPSPILKAGEIYAYRTEYEFLKA